MSKPPAHPATLSGLLPIPRHLEPRGEAFALRSDAFIAAAETFRPAAEILAGRLRASTGWKWEVRPLDAAETAAGQRIVLREAAMPHGPEAFRLTTAPELIEITASHAAGAYYGTVTLLQLLPPGIFGEAPLSRVTWTLPAATIEDWPRFGWRGVMLDSVRHFQPVEYIRKFIDLASQHKLNVVHWHLTDDQGWRLEIRKYPKLTGIGSRRRETVHGHLELGLGGDGIPVEGYYTQAQVRDLVSYAAARNVRILPEIEMPGHAKATVASYPELGCTDQSPEVSTTWGIHDTLFNVKPETFAFLRDVLDEVCELFPFEYVHVGGDEAVKTQWKNDPATQARIRELGLRDENHLQSWFIGQMAAHLRSRGKKLIGWDEIIEGGLAEGCTVMSWRGSEGAIQAASLGHDAVMSSCEAYYFDHSQSEDRANEPLNIGGFIPLQKAYQYNPIPEQLTPEQAARILGVQCQLWAEYLPAPSRLEYMAFPRVCALAEVGWSDPAALDFGDFHHRLNRHLRRLDCQDVRYRALDPLRAGE